MSLKYEPASEPQEMPVRSEAGRYGVKLTHSHTLSHTLTHSHTLSHTLTHSHTLMNRMIPPFGVVANC